MFRAPVGEDYSMATDGRRTQRRRAHLRLHRLRRRRGGAPALMPCGRRWCCSSFSTTPRSPTAPLAGGTIAKFRPMARLKRDSSSCCARSTRPISWGCSSSLQATSRRARWRGTAYPVTRRRFAPTRCTAARIRLPHRPDHDRTRADRQEPAFCDDAAGIVDPWRL